MARGSAPILFMLIASMAGLPACGARGARVHDEGAAPAEAENMIKKPRHLTHRAFRPGPAIHPSTELLEWLDGLERNDPRPLIRLPVVIEYTSPRGISIAGAWIGGPGVKQGPDTIRLRLDDGGMGISLVETARGHCHGDGPCALWLEGHWGALVSPAPPSGERGDDIPSFAVLGVQGPVGEDGPGHPLRAWIEKNR